MSNSSYKFGEWNKNPDIIRIWKRADYFINNQELFFDKLHIDILQPLHSRKAVFVKMVLYALFDLTENNPKKDVFNISEIFITIQKKKPLYKLLIKYKAENILQRINERKHQKANMSYDFEAKNKSTMQKFVDGLNKRDKVQYHDIYYSLALLFGIFINTKITSKNKDYDEILEEESKYYSAGYYLNKDGFELMEKFKKQQYLL